MKSKLFFYFPILYFLHTRIASVGKLVSWMIIYCVPTFFILYNYSTLSFLHTLISYLLQILLIYTFYEVGYIQNDCETIKDEVNPTLRLTAAELAYYEKHKAGIYLTRLGLGGCLSAALWHLNNGPDTWPFITVAASIILIYQVYNKIRSRFTLVLHFILVCLRFLSYPILFVGSNTVFDFNYFCLLLIFPILNLMERGSNKKFQVKFLQYLIPDPKHLNSFRVWYYFSASLMLGILVYFQWTQLWVLCLSLYFLFYRFMIVKVKMK